MDNNYTIVAIHQPNYIPWLGYFYKIYKCDIFVFHDDVQFSKSGMHNYHYIKSEDGPLRLKIPVEQKLGYKINEVRTKDELNWKTDHLEKIEKCYRKAKFFNEIYSDFCLILKKDYNNLSMLNSCIIKFFCEKLNIKRSFVNASELELKTSREEKVIDIVESLKGKIYYSGTGAQVYQKEDNFTVRGITLVYSNFQSFDYQQLYSNFQANVTILDYLMNCGYNWNQVLEHQKS